ncbi:hypothetical protein [Rhodococcus sp. JVH1]|uniref:hypothetical protein n=1 Tax=Rhodococcus sp. JVH1 TaxID=745408 RepID=UPI000271F036|nr:hypothetical protein [Rhodococcus sp. JVH1]EJI93529.1 hypothetical protein JVH1_9127 [Rhodococcus sp. JVH1]
MIIIRRPEEAEKLLDTGTMVCPSCRGPLAKRATVTSAPSAPPGAATVRPSRVRSRECTATHILLPTAMHARRADTTEVIGSALIHKAKVLGFRRSADRLARSPSTVRRWLRRTTDEHLQRMGHQDTRQLIESPAKCFPRSGIRGTRCCTPCTSSRQRRPRIVAATGSPTHR